MSARAQELLEAVNHLAAGDWQRAHEIVQEHEDDPLANWGHAIVHLMEGDRGNAAYWYRRSARPEAETWAIAAQVAALRAAIVAQIA
jgi:hypothetical protein